MRFPTCRTILPRFASVQSLDWPAAINAARAGDVEELGRLLESARGYLHVAADRLIEDDLRGKLSASDLVQDTFCEAQLGFEQFRGHSRQELLAWLKQILVHNLLNEYRRLRGTQKRAVSREVPLEAHSQDFADPASSPSAVMMRQEVSERLDRALGRLSAEHQRVIVLRHREGLSYAEISRRMGRSPDAVRMLWARAFDQLSLELDSER